MKAVLDMWASLGELDAIIGDTCSVVCQPLGLLSAAWNIPQVSNDCTSDALSDTKTYPTFTRVVAGYMNYIHVQSKILKIFNFTGVALVTETAELFKLMADYGKNYFEAQGQEVIYKVFSTTAAVKDGKEIVLPDKIEKLRQIVRELKTQTRCFVLLMYTTGSIYFPIQQVVSIF